MGIVGIVLLTGNLPVEFVPVLVFDLSLFFSPYGAMTVPNIKLVECKEGHVELQLLRRNIAQVVVTQVHRGSKYGFSGHPRLSCQGAMIPTSCIEGETLRGWKLPRVH